MLRLRSGAVREPVAISAIPFGYLRRDAIGDRVYAMRTFSVGALNAAPRLMSMIAELTRTRGVDEL